MPIRARVAAVNPTGMVDLTTMTARGLMRMTSRMTDSTDRVSK